MKELLWKGAYNRNRKSPSKQAIVVLNSYNTSKKARGGLTSRGSGGVVFFIRCIFVHGPMTGGL